LGQIQDQQQQQQLIHPPILRKHSSSDFEAPQKVSTVEIKAALRDMEVPAEQWNAAKKEPMGARMDGLAFDVIRWLRRNDSQDVRWAEHLKKYGCSYQGTRNRPTCQCPLWESVLDLTRIVLNTIPRPGEA
jgi:hypothetical protein